ncbi:PH-like domain-containing protein [Marisediminicola senii]|uniref:PH-like domain-containing protein n=1 Tax=Marisediminicola senii TaxID=2711233 RepID=UPI0013EC928B|nr:hypothetical protein [Marisediminicola senii]
MDSRYISAGIVLAFLALLLVLMYLGWRRRQGRQSAIPRPAGVPADPGAELISLEVFYVASTVAGQPLDRIAVAGLGYRARAVVTVHESGVALDIPGEPVAFIPAGDIGRVDRATWTIDRVVESDGLVRLAWTLGDTGIDSYLRVTEPADPGPLIGAIETITRTPEGVGNEGM